MNSTDFETKIKLTPKQKSALTAFDAQVAVNNEQGLGSMIVGQVFPHAGVMYVTLIDETVATQLQQAMVQGGYTLPASHVVIVRGEKTYTGKSVGKKFLRLHIEQNEADELAIDLKRLYRDDEWQAILNAAELSLCNDMSNYIEQAAARLYPDE